MRSRTGTSGPFDPGATLVRYAAGTFDLPLATGLNQTILAAPAGGTVLVNLPESPPDGYTVVAKNVSTSGLLDIRGQADQGIETNAPPVAAWGVAAGDAVRLVFDATTSYWWITGAFDRP